MISNLWEVALIIQNVYNSMRLSGYQINGVLIIRELDLFPVDLFSDIFLLFQSENMFIEVILESFVRIVDTQLFKAVHFEVLKIRDT